MSFRWYLFLITVATFLSLIAFAYVLFSIDPYSAESTDFTFFYSSLFLAAAGILILFNLSFRYLLYRDGNAVLHYAGAIFREGFLFALTIVSLALLLATHYFAWWSGSLIIIFFGGLEVLVLTSKDHNHHEEYV